MYEALIAADTSGILFDIGGGGQVPYRDFLKCKTYKSVNINQNVSPTWGVNIGEPFPCEAGFCDIALSLNTLEHVYDADFIIREAERALKCGGRIILGTPFMYPVHGCPDDFFRPTPSWYQKTLLKYSFTSITVRALVFGPFSNGAFVSGLPGPAKRVRMWAAMAMDLLYSRFRKIPSKMRGPSAAATGFWVTAIKK